MNKFLILLIAAILLFTVFFVTPTNFAYGASTVTIGVTGMYSNLTEAMPYLYDGDQVVFVSDVHEDPNVVIDINISVYGNGYDWIFDATSGYGLIVMSTPLRPTEFTLNGVNIYVNDYLESVIYTNASRIDISNVTVNTYVTSSSYRYLYFIHSRLYSWDSTMLMENITVINPSMGAFYLWANGTTQVNTFINNLNFSYQYGLYSTSPDFFDIKLYNDSNATIALNEIYIDPVQNGITIASYDYSYFDLFINQFSFDWSINNAFNVYAGGLGGSLYASDGYFWTDEAFVLDDNSQNGITVNILNMYVDYTGWDLLDFYIDSPGTPYLHVHNLYGDYIGDEAFYISGTYFDHLDLIFHDITLNYVDEESIYLDTWDSKETILSVDGLYVDETDDDDTIYVYFTGDYGWFLFNNLTIIENDEDDGLDLNDGSQVYSSWYLTDVYVGDDMEDDAFDFYMWGPGISDVYIGNSEFYDSFYLTNFNRPDYNVTIYHSIIDGYLYLWGIDNLSLIETFFYETYAYIGNGYASVMWTIGVKVISTLTGLPAAGVDILILDGSKVISSGVTSTNGLALVPIVYTINNTYRLVPNMIVRSKVKTNIENFTYGFSYTMPSWYEYFYIKIPVLVADISGVSSAGLFRLNLRGKQGTITVLTIADPINNYHRVIRYKIIIDRVYAGLDVFVVDIRIRYKIGDRWQWYPGQMIFDFNTNIIILNGPISYLVKI